MEECTCLEAMINLMKWLFLKTFFDLTFIARILNHLYNMIFKFTPKSSFESPNPYLEQQFVGNNHVHGANVLS